jgi:hypothetical protein
LPFGDHIMDCLSLRADCAQCAALCCVALAFDRSDLFAMDKPAGQPCPNLSARGRCTIHASRAARGFAGCAGYDCLGAGQHVTGLFAGRTWRDGPETAQAMFDAFAMMRQVHELVLLLRTARGMPLSATHRAQCEALLALLDKTWAIADLPDFAMEAIAREVRAFLAALRGYVSIRTGTSCAGRPADRSSP